MSDDEISQLVDRLLTLIDKNSEAEKRLSFFPIMDLLSYSFYNRQEAAMWTSKKLDYPKDKPQFEALPKDQKDLLKKIVRFFAVADGAVSENLSFRFQLEAKNYEERSMFIIQNLIELVHAETYGYFLEMFIPNKEEQTHLLQTINECPPMQAKMAWIRKYTASSLPKWKRFFAFACVEGIFFPALFCIIFWYRAKGILTTFAFANEEIAKDETLHRNYGCEMFKRYKDKTFDSEELMSIFKEAVEIECSFADYLLPEPIEDLNNKDIKRYVKAVSDNMLDYCDIQGIYKETNPYLFANDALLQQKTNFYEGLVGNYKGFNLKNADNWRSKIEEKTSGVDVFRNPEKVYF